MNGTSVRIAAVFLACAAYAAMLSLIFRSLNPLVGYNGLKAVPDLAVLLLMLAPFWLVRIQLPRAAVIGAVLVSGLWMFAYAAQLQFLSHTGTFASRPLLIYSFTHLEDVAKVAMSGADNVLVIELILGAVLIAAAVSLRPLRQALTLPLGRVALGSLVVLVMSVSIFLPVSGSAVAGPIFSAGYADDLPAVLGPQREYRAPRLIQPISADITRPNIVMWIIESGRADMIDLESEKPNPQFINRLARESLYFERAYTTTTHTSKSLIGILCGHYPLPVMQIVEAIPGRLPLTCLPKLLAEAGYQTVFLQAALGAFENRRGLTGNLGYAKTVVQEDLDPSFKKAGYLSMDERALLQPLEEAAKNAAATPSFITLLTNLTHHPYAPPGMKTPEESAPNAYGTAVEYVDDFLEEAYILMGKYVDWDNTILIVLSDHGEAFGEHGLSQHDSVSYEEVVRVPLFIRYPPRLKPSVDNRLRQTTDILPSLLELVGLPWEGEIVGKSLLQPDGHDHVVTTCWPTRSCHGLIRADGMKVIFNFGPASELFFDLNNDRRESANLAASTQSASAIVEGMKRISIARNTAESPYARSLGSVSERGESKAAGEAR